MKNQLSALCAVLAAVLACCAAEISSDYSDGEKSADLVTPEVKAAAAAMLGSSNAAAFLHAMQLNMAKYDIDMQTQSGRRNWHGRFVGEEIYTNELVKVEIYSNAVDGTVWRYKTAFKPRPTKATRRKTSYTTNGIPAKLAAARAARAAQIDGETVVTNIETTANR